MTTLDLAKKEFVDFLKKNNIYDYIKDVKIDKVWISETADACEVITFSGFNWMYSYHGVDFWNDICDQWSLICLHNKFETVKAKDLLWFQTNKKKKRRNE